MTGNVLVYIFFALFFLFLVESIYFLRKKLSMGAVVPSNQAENQSGGKWILIGGLLIVAILIASFGFFFFSRQKTPSPDITQKATPTVIPTFVPSPRPNEIVYTFPTVTKILPSPTLAIIVTLSPSKVIIPTKTPTPTKMPFPTPTPKLKVPTASPTITLAIGGPETASPIVSPAKTESTSSAVIVPKMPVAGAIGQTLVLMLVAISSVVVGIIL